MGLVYLWRCDLQLGTASAPPEVIDHHCSHLGAKMFIKNLTSKKKVNFFTNGA
jgi:hypothetical protein